METTINLLDEQIKQRLSGIHDYEPIHINHVLSEVLDAYHMPQIAKLACLTIDTAMRHLENVEIDHTSKKSILVGDLLSAHFYTLLAQLNEPTYQRKISRAVIEINELKSAIHTNRLPESSMGEAIIKIENSFPLITIQHFSEIKDIKQLNCQLLTYLETHHPPYLKNYSKAQVRQFLEQES
ncbi:heptaprenyl pyrophosphate synthase subunit A [Staphylococcus auricularis]|uniref:Heptaprenyl pyrophosphate synthase subunit A n=1 Tax=Staphylococcus auricularis TaxID=29379 RepID=A0ABX5IFW5_9STAP|nr:heptaprenyl pyrophosphate synthase subunit A [Staphylococcus auricularis]MCE5038093.1 heptaprenyl pyrophosphate synthase subunit A [Staphylococcus auricularis]MEB6569387.1 heptaprenyl pyrophosphate synthase subunit A [Staphylococcus auricularis]PTH19087.1 heptaprenyl pyrophosphate synthase subunit A [Staphylococcus auricularis]PTH26852.1 heptaprenyl pyrophosphate synthase subunit A [Staphylococcus auricularis]